MIMDKWLRYWILQIVIYSVSGWNDCSLCTNCEVISGLFQREILSSGYNLVITIPKGSCNVTIYEQEKSQNFLALRSKKNYIINGNWEIVPRGRYMGAGTGFDYFYYANGDYERIFTPGSIDVDIDVMVIYQAGPVNVYYKYYRDAFVLSDEPDILPYKRKLEEFNHNYYLHDMTFKGESSLKGSWKVWKFTPCSKSCGGGNQGTLYICTASDGRILEDSDCRNTKPPPQMIVCNTHPCQPNLTYSQWSPCSVTCGMGQRFRSMKCIQEVSPSVVLNLPLTSCRHLGPPDITSKVCNMNPCTRWQVGAWSECSVGCGTGLSTRTVSCMAENSITLEDKCNPQEKPLHQRLCHSFSCARNTWFFTEWSVKCIGGCEHGVHVRDVWCSPGSKTLGGRCFAINKPPVTKPCTNSHACGPIWFAGPWSECSMRCRNGTQNREVVCVRQYRGSFRMTFEGECDPDERPMESASCNPDPCPPQWYFTDWSQCSSKCGGGSRRRNVQCLDEEEKPALNCNIKDRPNITQACNFIKCGTSRSKCRDKFENCLLVQRARLCRYTYYHSICCATCSQQ